MIFCIKILCVAFYFVFSITDTERALIEEINNDPQSTFKVKEYPSSFLSKVKSSLMKTKSPKVHRTHDTMGRIVNIDTTFDDRVMWGKLILPVRDQEKCGGWAFAIAEITGDRIGIETGIIQEDFSPQDLISCDTTSYGCSGAEMDVSWNWVKTNGITTESCIPFVSGENDIIAPCPSTCVNGSEIVRTRAKSLRPVPYVEMQEELATNGPFEVDFDVYLDFALYQSGVYRRWNSPINTYNGRIPVVLAGWGMENESTPYWLVQNSWGPDWGESGYFRVLRGRNECGIEDNGFAALF